MAQRDQLEVVSPNGEIQFFDLDERDGVTNVGRNASNDVVLTGQGIADFHFLIDHRRIPYQLTVLDANAATQLGGTRLQPNRQYPVQGWDTIQAGPYTFILVEGDRLAAAAPTQVAPGVGPALPTGGGGPVGGAGGYPPQVAPAAPTAGPTYPQTPSALPTALSGSAPVPLPTARSLSGGMPTLTGAGAPVMTPSLPAGQPTVQPPVTPTVQTGSGAAGGSSSAPPVITPPTPTGAPTNGHAAPGSHAIGDLMDDVILLEVSAREQVIDVDQTASWQMTIINGGALVARFDVHLEGWIDGKWVTVQPTSVNLFEGGRALVGVEVSPPRLPTSRAGEHHFALVVTSSNYPGHRAQRAVKLVINPYYEFTVGEPSPRQQSVNYFRRAAAIELPVQNRGNSETHFRIEGMDDQNQITFELESPTEKTRFARQLELALAPEQTVKVPISATPRNHRFIGVGSEQHALTLTTTMLAPQPASRAVLANVRNRPVVGPWLIFAVLGIIAAVIVFMSQPNIDAFAFAPGIVQTTTEAAAAPAINTQALATQAAKGGKIFGIKIPPLPKLPPQLSFLNSYWPGASGTVTTTVTAPLTAAMVNAGTDVTLIWETTRVQSLTLEKLVGAEKQFIATIDNPGDVRQYSFRADLRERATYILTAHNWIERLPYVGQTLGVDEARLGLIVDPVEPVIEVFQVTPASLVTGQSVNITWNVQQAQEYELLVNGVPRPLDTARGSIVDTPMTSTEYQVVARSPYWDVPVESERAVINVALPTPVIRSFSISPEPLVNGDGMQVAWDVTGASSVTIDPFPGQVLNQQGQEQQVWADAGKTQQTFTLLAVNGEGPDQVRAITTRVVEIVLATPTVTPTPTETPTPLPTATPIPTPLIRSFDIQPRPIVDGQNVTIIWAVEGASNVEINPVLGSGQNPEGQSEIQIDPGKSQETFTLRATFGDGTSMVEARSTRIVPIVTATPTVTPTPTPSPTITPQAPVIQVFTLSPREVVRGDAVSSTTNNAEGTASTTTLPELTWTVVGDATNVEISAPDFGPVRNLPKQGTLRVPADQTTVYQLNVYFGDDIVASQTQELTVIEPTPTPTLTPVPPTPEPPPSATPTPTFTPTPNIVSFTVNAVDANDQVVPFPSEDNVPTYQVEAGTQIRLAWRIENPVTEVRLTDSTNDYGSRSAEDEFQVTVTQSTVFQLSVTGTQGRRIRINVTALEPPPPPFNVSGINSATDDQPATVTWDYPGESQGRILGFRIYRANINNSNFSLVADRFELDNTVKSWADPSTPSCDRVYYVVAVYEDITLSGDNRFQETAASATSWNTRPCQ